MPYPGGLACDNYRDNLRSDTHTTQSSSHHKPKKTLDFHNPKPQLHMQNIQGMEYNNSIEEATKPKLDNRIQEIYWSQIQHGFQETR